MYEYKFVQIPFSKNFAVKRGQFFEECKDIINEEAKNGWRLKQVVTPANEKTGVAGAYEYQIIFEKKIAD